MSLEAAAVIDVDGKVLFWHTPENRSIGYLPDSKTLWDILLANNNILSGVAHSHPGSGEPWPSHEDVTTFAAVEAGLGKRLTWWITTKDQLAAFRWVGPSRLEYHVDRIASENEPSWVTELRKISDL